MSLLNQKLTILIVEDNPGDAFLLNEYLHNSSLSLEVIHVAPSLKIAKEKISEVCFSVVLLDLSLPDSDGLNSLNEINNMANGIPVIVLTGLSDSVLAIDAIKAGAQDYLIKDEITISVLGKTIQYAIERKHITQALALSNQRFELIAKASFDMIWEWDLKTNQVYREPNGLKNLLGYTVSSFTDLQSWMNVIHPEDLPYLQSTLQEVTSNNKKNIYEAEYRMIRADGSLIHVLDRGYVGYNNQEAVKIVGATKNITESKKVVQELKVSEQKFRLLFERSACSIFLFDAQTFEILEVNETAVHTYGYTRKELLLKKITDIRPQEDIPKFLEALKSPFSSKQHKKRISKHLKKNGEIMLVQVVFYRIKYSRREAFLAQTIDISETIQLKDELAQLEKVNQQKILKTTLMVQEKERSVLGTELHDNINQILTATKLYLEMGISRQEFELCRKGMNYLQLAIEEIRKLSKSLVTPAFHADSLHIALQELIDLISTTRNIRFNVDTNMFDESHTDLERKTALYRIIQEQLNNIIKHAAATEVNITLENRDQKIWLTITDNGVGFDTTKKPQGIGLTNIRNRAAFYEGTATINSELGKGTVLKVMIIE